MALECHVGPGFNRRVQRTRHTSVAKPVSGRAGACKFEIVGLDNGVESRGSRHLRLSCIWSKRPIRFRGVKARLRPKAENAF
jgi:hypothetical protein